MTARRLKLVILVGGLAASALALIAWTQVWFDVVLESGAALSVRGDAAAAALAALALSGVALAGALTIAGPVFRAILAVLEFAIGGLIVGSAIGALVDPVAAVSSAVTAATAESGAETIRSLVVSVVGTPWPVIGGIAGAMLAVAGIAVLVTSRQWPSSSRRYQSVRFADADEGTDRNAVSDWDALSNGRDPT
jgi:hypothetical protein